MHWEFALILFVLATVVPWRGAVRMRQLLQRPSLTTTDRLALYASTIAFQWLATAVVAWRAHARGLSPAQLGLSVIHAERVIVTAGGLAVLLALGQLVSLRYVARLPPEKQGLLRQMAEKVLPHNLVDSLVFTALTVTVALCEEFLYRGFIYAVLERATSSAGIAAAGSAGFFAIAHVYQGARGMRTTFIVGVLFAVSRIWTGSILPAVVTHLIVDLLAGFVAPRWLGTAQSLGVQAAASAPSKEEHS